jgi:hypothetical protein
VFRKGIVGVTKVSAGSVNGFDRLVEGEKTFSEKTSLECFAKGFSTEASKCLRWAREITGAVAGGTISASRNCVLITPKMSPPNTAAGIVARNSAGPSKATNSELIATVFCRNTERKRLGPVSVPRRLLSEVIACSD